MGEVNANRCQNLRSRFPWIAGMACLEIHNYKYDSNPRSLPV